MIRFSKRCTRILLLICLAFVCIQGKLSKANDRPNVIIVMTDDQGYGDLSCHGNPILKTPNLDQLAADSIRFTDFHVSPFCTPTRASLMTGNSAGFTGAFRTSSGRTMMHRDEKTIANLFADAGYVTGMVGKWHLGDNAPHRPQDRGFRDVVWHRCGGIGQASDHWGNDYFDDTYERNGKFEEFKGYCTDVWFREGMRFIDENKSKPFLLYLATNAPHGPYRVPPEWAEPYQGNKEVANANFFGMIANFDHNMGLLREQLNKLDLAENTILIFMTDNGTAAGSKFKGLDSEPVVGFNAGMRGKKSSVYDGGHRVPFFIHWPAGNLSGGKKIDTLAAHIDVLPTLADLCGIAVADEYQPDGVSLKPLLDGNDQPWKRQYLVEQFLGGAGGNKLPPVPYEFSVVMTERWRLVNSNEQELYDIQADPGQRDNIADQHPDVVNQLRTHYDQFWKRVEPRLTPVRIDIGNPAENPTVLCSQDWRMPTGNPPWNFNSIKRLPKVVGPWMLHVKSAGKYRITLRQYPQAANKEVVAVKAKIEIAGLTKERPVEAGSHGVEFEVDLPEGPTKLVTYLYNEKGKAGGAYFTEVEALSNVSADSPDVSSSASIHRHTSRQDADKSPKAKQRKPNQEPESTLGLAAPDGAEILFDGTNFDQWRPFSFGKINRNDDQKEIQWNLVDGDAMQISFEYQGKKRKQFICTKNKFGNYRLHLEFQLPDDGGKGNSGIFFGPLYELQILDSAEKEEPGLIHCGAIYQIRAPDTNAALKPGEWQTIDLEYHAAGFDKDGDRMESKAAQVTIRMNGQLIHEKYKLKLRRNKYAAFPEEPTSPIVLQEHGSPVKFRNIWLVENHGKEANPTK